MLFDWPFEKFKNWSAIAPEMRTIRNSREGSSKRTWKNLWNAINSYLEHSDEDAIQQVLSAPNTLKNNKQVSLPVGQQTYNMVA